MNEKKLDKLIDDITERFKARDVEGVNKLWAGLSEKDQAAFNERLKVRAEQKRVESEQLQKSVDEMLRLSGKTREQFDAEIAEADKGKLSLFKSRK